MGLDDELKAYYEAEARAGHRSSLSELREHLRASFVELLRHEGRTRIADIGAGPGLDTLAFRDRGFAAVALDLAHANVERARARGLVGVTGSLHHLPFTAGAFDALWTMSTFVHVPDDRFDDGIRELIRVARPGAPLAIGTWGGFDFEGVREFGELRPYRFFSLASHDRWHQMLAAHGRLEQFETFEPAGTHGWQYQFAVLRAPG